MYEQRDTYVPIKHQADYRDRGNWGTTKNRNINRMVYSSKSYEVFISINTVLSIFSIGKSKIG